MTSGATPPGRRAPLSRELLVETAMRLARANGLDGVTMRTLAAELDVTPMAIYYHVAGGKSELITLMGQHVTDSTPPFDASLGWEEAVRRRLLWSWETHAKYPGLAHHMISLPTMGVNIDGYKAGIEFLTSEGFPERTARLAWNFALTYLHGRLGVDSRLDREAARAAGVLSGIPAREHVSFDLDAVVAGMRAMLEATNASDRERAAPTDS